MVALESCPGGIDDEGSEDQKRAEGLSPPCVAPHRGAEAARLKRNDDGFHFAIGPSGCSVRLTARLSDTILSGSAECKPLCCRGLVARHSGLGCRQSARNQATRR